MGRRISTNPVIYGKTRCFRLEIEIDQQTLYLAKRDNLTISEYLRKLIRQSTKSRMTRIRKKKGKKNGEDLSTT